MMYAYAYYVCICTYGMGWLDWGCFICMDGKYYIQYRSCERAILYIVEERERESGKYNNVSNMQNKVPSWLISPIPFGSWVYVYVCFTFRV